MNADTPFRAARTHHVGGEREPVPTAAANRPARDAHIDAMRAVAVLLVVVAHAGLGSVIPGGSGVTIFFTISGFVITRLLLREYRGSGGFRWVEFYKRRCLKLGPPLFVLTLVPTLIYALLAHLAAGSVAAQAFFYYNWLKANGLGGAVLPGSEVVWSLAIEEQFYVLVAVAWILLIRSRHAIGLLLLVGLTVAIWATVARIVIASGAGTHLLTPEGGSDARIYYGSDTRADAIALGLLAALLHEKWQRIPGFLRRLRQALDGDWALPVALGLYLGSLVVRDAWFRDTFRYTLQSVATVIVILYGFGGGRVTGRTRRVVFDRLVTARPLQAVGLASYSIYLVHFEVVVGFRELFADVTGVGRAVSVVALGLGFGMACHRWVEVPVARRRRPSPASAPAVPRLGEATTPAAALSPRA